MGDSEVVGSDVVASPVAEDAEVSAGVEVVDVGEVVDPEVSTAEDLSEDESATSCALAHEVRTSADTAQRDPSSSLTSLIMPCV